MFLTQLEEKTRVGARRGLVLATCLVAEGHSVLRHSIQGEQAKNVHSEGRQSSVHHVGGRCKVATALALDDKDPNRSA